MSDTSDTKALAEMLALTAMDAIESTGRINKDDLSQAIAGVLVAQGVSTSQSRKDAEWAAQQQMLTDLARAEAADKIVNPPVFLSKEWLTAVDSATEEMVWSGSCMIEINDAGEARHVLKGEYKSFEASFVRPDKDKA